MTKFSSLLSRMSLFSGKNALSNFAERETELSSTLSISLYSHFSASSSTPYISNSTGRKHITSCANHHYSLKITVAGSLSPVFPFLLPIPSHPILLRLLFPRSNSFTRLSHSVTPSRATLLLARTDVPLLATYFSPPLFRLPSSFFVSPQRFLRTILPYALHSTPLPTLLPPKSDSATCASGLRFERVAHYDARWGARRIVEGIYQRTFQGGGCI